MRDKLAGLFGKARALESRIAGTIGRAAERAGGTAPLQPLEIVHRIVEQIEDEIQPAGRGRRSFPYNQIRVHLAAASPQAKARLQAMCEGPPSLQDRIAERLRTAGCGESDLAVKVIFAGKARPDWPQPEFHLEFARLPPTERVAAAAVASRLELTVMKGSAEHAKYAFTTTPITIGRGAEVRDSRHRLLRTNRIAFADGGDDINQSVSRRHAHIGPDVLPGRYRIFDDGSAQGTSVIRRGRGLQVPLGSRGMALQSGDEILLGQARVRAEVIESPSE